LLQAHTFALLFVYASFPSKSLGSSLRLLGRRSISQAKTEEQKVLVIPSSSLTAAGNHEGLETTATDATHNNGRRAAPTLQDKAIEFQVQPVATSVKDQGVLAALTGLEIGLLGYQDQVMQSSGSPTTTTTTRKKKKKGGHPQSPRQRGVTTVKKR